MQNLHQEYSVSSQYFAPRGKERLMFLGESIVQRHLHFEDKLIGVIGDSGSGKSSLIKGMFPGLELSNDDDVINPAKIMQVRGGIENIESASIYHLDIRFQTAFTQMYEIVDFVNEILEKGRRVVIEHFNLLFPMLGKNADLMIGIGEEIIVTRPSIFGPLPESIFEIVHASLKYRKMAHSAEDITIELLKEFNIGSDLFYSSDIRNGFLLRFQEKPDLDFKKLAERIDYEIKSNLNISYYDESHIVIGTTKIYCAGARFHIKNTSEITNFKLIEEFIFDEKTNTYCLIGLVDDISDDLSNRNTSHFLTRNCIQK